MLCPKLTCSALVLICFLYVLVCKNIDLLTVVCASILLFDLKFLYLHYCQNKKRNCMELFLVHFSLLNSTLVHKHGEHSQYLALQSPYLV